MRTASRLSVVVVGILVALSRCSFGDGSQSSGAPPLPTGKSYEEQLRPTPTNLCEPAEGFEEIPFKEAGNDVKLTTLPVFEDSDLSDLEYDPPLEYGEEPKFGYYNIAAKRDRFLLAVNRGHERADFAPGDFAVKSAQRTDAVTALEGLECRGPVALTSAFVGNVGQYGLWELRGSDVLFEKTNDKLLVEFTLLGHRGLRLGGYSYAVAEPPSVGDNYESESKAGGVELLNFYYSHLPH